MKFSCVSADHSVVSKKFLFYPYMFFFNYIFFHAYCVTRSKKQNTHTCKDKAKDPEYTAQNLSQTCFSLINIKQMLFAPNKSLKRHSSARPAILVCSLWFSIKKLNRLCTLILMSSLKTWLCINIGQLSYQRTQVRN